MNENSPIYYLDKVLFSFDASNRNRGVHSMKISNTMMAASIKIERPILTEILFKLVKDGYLRIEVDDALYNFQTHKNINFYLLTLEGEIFQLSGGYTQETETNAKNESRKSRNDRRLIWATWSAGIAAILLLLWQAWIWFYPLRNDFLHRNDTEKVLPKKTLVFLMI